MRIPLLLTVTALRTNCISNISKNVDVVIVQKYHPSLSSWWVEIAVGGSTGYESMKIDNLKDRIDKGWTACSGTKGRWDTLFLPPESMLQIYNWISEEQTQNEREHANALTKESPGSCSPGVQKERIKNDVD